MEVFKKGRSDPPYPISRLQHGSLSAADAVRASLQSIAAHSDLLAFISLRAGLALAEAEAEDASRAAGSTPGPLWGIPLAVKDLIDLRGLPTTAASRVRHDAPPAENDAECVRRLRAAGAIIVGKTNLHEFAYGGSGIVSAYGAPRNPLDLARVCGGLSSGSAAAVAAHMCFGALGTDTAGSIRLPAACCGVVGFKPTWARSPSPESFPSPGPMTTLARSPVPSKTQPGSSPSLPAGHR